MDMQITGAQANKLPVGSVVTNGEEILIRALTEWVWVNIIAEDPAPWVTNAVAGEGRWSLLIGEVLVTRPKVGDIVTDAAALDLLPVGSVVMDQTQVIGSHTLNIKIYPGDPDGDWEFGEGEIMPSEVMISRCPVRVLYIPEES